MKVFIKLHGQLYWYVKKQKKLEIETNANTIRELIDRLKIPIGEVSFITSNGNRVELSESLHENSTIEIYPVIGGG